jgi:hypothetical protein
MNIRRGLARIAHDQAEHLTTLALHVQNELERFISFNNPDALISDPSLKLR